MLPIPDSVKTLFKTDGVLKNVRVWFPNGEHPDILNDQIIKESLKFTENISTREEIKFGLCEGNTISFECVDVGNIKGFEIEVDIEIDVSSISPRPSGTRTTSDVPFPYYPIGLGQFVVDECKRDAKMLKRKVTAYSKISDLNRYDWWTEVNWALDLSSMVTEPKAISLNVINYIAVTNPELFYPEVESTLSLSWSGTQEQIVRGFYNESHQYFLLRLKPWVYYADVYALDALAPYPSSQMLGRVDRISYDSDYESDLASVCSQLTSLDVDDNILAKFVDFIKEWYPFNPATAYKMSSYYYQGAFADADKWKGKTFGTARNDIFLMPPRVAVATYIDVEYIDPNNVEHSLGRIKQMSNTPLAGGLRITEVSVWDEDSYSIPVTPKYVPNDNDYYLYSFFENFMNLNMRKLLEGSIELVGKFGRISRFGDIELLSISDLEIDGLFPVDDLYPADDLYPMEATAFTEDTDNMAVVEEEATISVWYEEYLIQFGGITLEYLNSEVLDEDNNPVQSVYENIWDSNKTIYNLSDNDIIRNGTYTKAEIESMTAELVNALQAISFYPSEVEIVGLPYVEAGDWVVPTVKGSQIITLSLSRSMSGIQALRDKMRSD